MNGQQGELPRTDRSQGWAELQPGSLRRLLRDGTAAEHQLTDDAFSTLDLTTPQGLGDYLESHARALQVVEPVLGAASSSLPPLPSRLALLRADLDVLGRPFPPACSFDLAAKAPLGIAYVVGGSHFGSKLLARRWRRSDDPQVLAAHNFVTDRSLGDYWDEISLSMRSRPDRQDELAVVETARSCFALYRQACDETKRAGDGHRPE